MATLIAQATIDAVNHPRLRDLASQYEITKAQAEEAEARHEEVKLQIKNELWGLCPDLANTGSQIKDQQTAQIELWVPDHSPFQLTAKSSWRIDSKGMKARDPAAYAKWAKRSISWSLTHGTS